MKWVKIMKKLDIQKVVNNYRVTIKERYKVLLHCEPNLRSSDLL